MHSDLFLLTLACAGDQHRVLSGEPWHFFNQLILLHLPSLLQNVTKDDLCHAQFWVQTYRLPFLSESRALAKKVGEWIGEFIDVHEDSLHEGWGSFMRTRVRIDINQPVMRGKMITLPRVKDEHWLEFRYENLLVFCFHCGKLGHPFDKCISFMELVDAGVEPELLYGPQMIGDKPPVAGYDRYRSDFSKANAYPFLTRLTRKTFASSIPAINTHRNLAIGVQPHPKSLTIVESSKPEKPELVHAGVKPEKPVTNPKEKYPELPLPFPSYIPTIFPTEIPPIQTSSQSANTTSPSLKIATTVQSAPAFVKSNVVAKNKDSVEGHSSSSAEVAPQQPRPHHENYKLECQEIGNGLEVPRVGLKGGLLLLWMANIDVTLNSYSMNHFDVLVSLDNCHQFHFTGFYGAPKTHLRINTWNLLSSLVSNDSNTPWLVLGDFNELLSNDDKIGGPPRDDMLMDNFRKTIDYCNLSAIPCKGDIFTWTNKNHHENVVRERLDKGFDFFIEDTQSHLDFYHLDHRAIAYVVSHWILPATSHKRHSRFHFEQFSLKDIDCRNIIQDSWHYAASGNPTNLLLQNIAASSDALQAWHFKKYGQMGRDIAEAHKTSTQLHNSRATSTDHIHRVENADKILDELLEKEVYWHQHARVDWLQSGDSNTKFFHSHAKTKNTTNKIKKLQAGNGGIVHTEEEITSDIEEALKSMAPDKSPGIDGMSAMFFQHHWDIVGPLVTQSLLRILNDGDDMDSINTALITLIPKIDKPKFVSDFRPIGLCTVLYKLVSKAIAARFKEALPHVISQNQSAFLLNCLMTDNVLLAFELVHCLKNKKRGRMGWVNLVMKCVTSATLSFNINGAVKGSVVPQRGLRQGDLLSPYLFLIFSEGLSALLQHEESLGHLKGLSIARGAPAISASGQLFNTEKAVMSFSPNATQGVKDRFNSVLGMPICALHEKYLGLPSYAGKDKKELFSGIKDRIWKLMNQWHAKLFSIGGWEALLAKQAWRILDIPNSLLAKNVRCATDPWLPGNTTFTPYSYGGDPFFTKKKKNNISANRQWDTQVLEHHFGDIEIERILSIPLSPFPKEDKLIWHHSDTGFYTVKTGYHLTVSLDSVNEHSSSSSHRQWWNRLWSLRLPKKVKIFAWRLINDALPTSMNLAYRKITPTTACSLCKCGWETIGHAIFCCDRAKAVWKKFRYNVYMPNIGNIKGFDIFSHLAATHNDADLQLITCLMWSIWSERNKEIHGTKPNQQI
uniref:CCHC-type domain-containing protein n=1 Tax=Cannabis sativa TaxID=3483 RepID=A0A803Q6Y9_CANSA